MVDINNLASTSFYSGAKDKLAVVDVYGDVDTKVKTSLLDNVKGIGANVIDTITADPYLLVSLSDSLSNKGTGIQFDREDLLNTLTSSSIGEQGKNMLGDLGGKLKSSIGSILQKVSIDPKTTFGAISKMGSIVDTLSLSDLSSANSLTSFMANLTGDIDVAKVINLDAEYAILGTFMNEALRAGSTGAFDKLLETYEGKDEYNYVVRRVMNKSVIVAVSTGNLANIKKLVLKLGRAAVLAELPNVISMILTFYHFPKKLKSREYRGELAKLIELLVLIDPTWSTYNRNGTLITRIDIFSYASENAKTLLRLDDVYKTEVMIAKDYPIINLMNDIRTKYPYLHFPKAV